MKNLTWVTCPSLNVLTQAHFPKGNSRPVARPRIRKSRSMTTLSPASISS